MADQKISQDTIITTLSSTSSFPVLDGGVNKQIFRDPLAVAIAQALGMSQVQFYVLEFDGTPQTVDCGAFWNVAAADLGDFFWEFWMMILPGGGSGHYVISEGYGGAHALLWSGVNGNTWDGTTVTSFAAGDNAYPNQWFHSAIGLCDNEIVGYYDGVPVCRVPFTTVRKAQGFGGLYICGSDHSNFIGRIAQVRGFEGTNPLQPSVGNALNQVAFIPQTGFGTQWGTSAIDPINCPPANFLMDFSRPEQIVPDKSAGYPSFGHTHSGRIRGSNLGITTNRSSYPAPRYVLDPNAPSPLSSNPPTQPAGKTYTPVTPPSGSLIFDSFQRKNSTFAWEGSGGLGSTEGGSLGPLTWVESTSVGTEAGLKPFGILNEKAVVLLNGARAAVVDAGQANLDIKVNRANGIFEMGITTSIVFRYVDDSNYFCAFQFVGGTLYVGKRVAGVDTFVINNLAMSPSNWTTLRVITKSNNTLQVYADATQLVNTTDSSLSSATKAGIGTIGSYFGFSLHHRWLNFTVLVAS